MKVSFVELRPAYEELRDACDAAYHRVMDSGWYLLGEELNVFEQEFASFCGTKYCIGVGNGLDALHLILMGYGIGTGDEVLVPSNTYIATWLAVSHAGAVPVAVEPDSATFNLDPSLVERAITRNTKAIMVVHLYGQPADMDAINSIAQQHGLKVIEDNAQAQGACFKGRRTGGLGHAAATSFYPAKNLGAFDDAGAVTTDDPQLADRIRMLRNYGSKRKYYHEEKGFNSRVGELQAAFLRAKLQVLESWNRRRQKFAAAYHELLTGVPGITLPSAPSWGDPVWHLYVIKHGNRDALQKHLADAGIQTAIHYPVPPHQSGAYCDNDSPTPALPIAERLAQSVLSLPMGPHLDGAQLTFVADTIKAFRA
jgi:dTDP-4-amino-4,6-dideoxygalactose transaminase